MEFTLAGQKFLATRYKLREWLKLDAVREKIVDAIEAKDLDGLSNSLCSFVSIASNVSTNILLSLPWYEIVHAYSIIEAENRLRYDFALLRTQKKSKDLPAWDYEGRTWFWWLHTLASKYGWSQEYIAELDIDDATGLLQEILTKEQLDREWQWSLTEIAYPYNETTKKSNFKPLEKPEWMMIISADKKPEIPTFRIRKDMLPVGIVARKKDKNEPIVN